MAIPAPLADKFCHLPPHSCKQDKICLKWLADFPTRRKFSGQSVSLSPLVHWCSCSGCHGAEEFQNALQGRSPGSFTSTQCGNSISYKDTSQRKEHKAVTSFVKSPDPTTLSTHKNNRHTDKGKKLQPLCTDVQTAITLWYFCPFFTLWKYLTSIIGKWLMFLLLHKARITYTANSDCRWVSV